MILISADLPRGGRANKRPRARRGSGRQPAACDPTMGLPAALLVLLAAPGAEGPSAELLAFMGGGGGQARPGDSAAQRAPAELLAFMGAAADRPGGSAAQRVLCAP